VATPGSRRMMRDPRRGECQASATVDVTITSKFIYLAKFSTENSKNMQLAMGHRKNVYLL
jgi:hypothetical protein